MICDVRSEAFLLPPFPPATPEGGPELLFSGLSPTSCARAISEVETQTLTKPFNPNENHGFPVSYVFISFVVTAALWVWMAVS